MSPPPHSHSPNAGSDPAAPTPINVDGVCLSLRCAQSKCKVNVSTSFESLFAKGAVGAAASETGGGFVIRIQGSKFQDTGNKLFSRGSTDFSLILFYLFLRNNLSLSIKAKSALSPFDGTCSECREVEAGSAHFRPDATQKTTITNQLFLLRISSSGAPAEPAAE